MKLTVENAAKCLEIPESTVERWIRQGRIPVHRTRDGVYFKEPDLRKWANKHHMPYTPPAADPREIENHEPRDLYDAMERGRVFHGIVGNCPDEVLGDAVSRLDFISPEQRSELLTRLMDREQLASTGIGKGVAVPHPRNPESGNPASSSIVTCFLESEVPYNAVDDQPVFVLFLLLSRTVKTHLNLLSRLSFCLRSKSFVEFLKTRPTHEELLGKIADFEKTLDGPSP